MTLYRIDTDSVNIMSLSLSFFESIDARKIVECKVKVWQDAKSQEILYGSNQQYVPLEGLMFTVTYD